MECARSPSWLAPSSVDHVHYQRIHSNAVPDTIRFVLDGSDLVLFTSSPATGTGLPMLQADISTMHNRMHCCSLHNFKTTKSHRARTAATNALIARKWLKRASGQYFTSHNNDDNNSNNGDCSNHSAGAADSSHGQDRNSSQQGSGSEQGSKDDDNTDKDNGGNGASSDGAGGGSNGNDDDDNRDNHRPRKSAHPDNNNNNNNNDDDEEDDSDIEQEGDDNHSGQQASQYSIKADLDRKDVNNHSQQQPTPVELAKKNGTSTAVKQERIAVDADTDTERDHPASTSTTARVPLPSSAPRSGDSCSRESIAPQQRYHQPSQPGSGSSATPSPQAPTAEASVSPQNKTPTHQLESDSNPAQKTPKPCKTAHKPTQKIVQNPTVQTTSPQARRPQPPLFTESPTSRSPQDPRPQQRRPLPQARPVQLGTPLQSPIITIQNVDKDETPHPLPSQAHTPQRSPHTKSPHQALPHQLSPHQTGRSPRRPLPQSRGGSRQPLSLAKPSPTSAEGLRIMPVATGSNEADPTDPCTANDVASFDMFWERALELLRRDNNKQVAGPQQQDQPPTRPVQIKQQALPEPTPNKGPVSMDIDEQPADVQDTQPHVHQHHPQQQNQRQLRPQMQPLAQPSIQPRPQPQRQEPTANIQHTERQFIVHVGPDLAASRSDRRKYCQSFYEESAEEEAARKKAKEERQRERLERQMIEEEENRRQRLQLHQQRIQQQVLKQQMHEQEISLRRQQQQQQQQHQQHKKHKQQQKGLDQHGKDQELRRQLAEQFKQQQLLEEERQRQIGDMDYYNRYLARKPPLQMLSELEEEERKQREQQQQDEMYSEQLLEEGNYRHDDPPRQSGSRTWPLERPGPLLQRPGPLLHQSAPLERPGPLLKQHAPLERPGPLLESSRDDQSSRPTISGSSARSTGRTTRTTRPIRPIRPAHARSARSAHPARPARPARSIHIAPSSSMTAAITQPLQLIATREGTVMSVDDYRDAHRRAVIEAREHLRRLEETDPLLPIERPDLVAQRTLPAAPPTLAPYTIPTTGDSAVPRSFKKVVAPCPCCNQYLKGYRDEEAPAVGEAAPRNT